jgi:hypothetical protein
VIPLIAGPLLADEILAAIAPVTREGLTDGNGLRDGRDAARLGELYAATLGERDSARLDEHERKDDFAPRSRAEPPGRVTQEYES